MITENTQSGLNVLIDALIRAVSPISNEIDQTLLLLLMYLCDWHCSVKYDCRFTNIVWKVSRRGLLEVGMETYIRTHADLYEVDDLACRVKVKCANQVHPNEVEMSVIERVARLYKEKQRAGLVTFVLSTYPILSASSEALVEIDLLDMARSYRALRNSI